MPNVNFIIRIDLGTVLGDALPILDFFLGLSDIVWSRNLLLTIRSTPWMMLRAPSCSS